jgi:ion channel-forming bestrophin family protein
LCNSITSIIESFIIFAIQLSFMLLNKRIPISYIFAKVRLELLYVTVIGLVVSYLTHEFKSFIPEMPIAIPAFIGTAISVLLSFKLNQSYDRWWEARKIWGSIVNDSRTLVIQLQSFLKDGNENAIRTIAYRHIAWLYSLGQSLRGSNPTDNIKDYLSEEDLKALEKHNNKPLAILQKNNLHLAALRKQEQIDVFSFIQANNTLVNFSNQMGMCERINSTVFPATYRKFLHWIIYLFVITLSIALQDITPMFELPLLLVISTAFFLLEKSATHLQDPFSNLPTDTAITTITRNIEINIKQLLNESDIPQPIEPHLYYSL